MNRECKGRHVKFDIFLFFHFFAFFAWRIYFCAVYNRGVRSLFRKREFFCFLTENASCFGTDRNVQHNDNMRIGVGRLIGSAASKRSPCRLRCIFASHGYFSQVLYCQTELLPVTYPARLVHSVSRNQTDTFL